VIRRWLPFIIGAGFVVWVAALVMLAMTAEGPQRFGELYLGILLVNITGVIALLVLIGGRGCGKSSIAKRLARANRHSATS